MSIDITIVQLNRYLQILRYFEEGEISEEDIKDFFFEHLREQFNDPKEFKEFIQKVLHISTGFSMIIEGLLQENIGKEEKPEKLLSNSELADVLNVSRQTIHNWNFDNVEWRGSKRMIPSSEISKKLKGSKYFDVWMKYINGA